MLNTELKYANVNPMANLFLFVFFAFCFFSMTTLLQLGVYTWKYNSLKYNFLFHYKGNLVYTSIFKCWGKKSKYVHLLQDKLVVFPHWYSKELFKQLASLELKMWILTFDFDQCRGNITFLHILWNITFRRFTEKSVIEHAAVV